MESLQLLLTPDNKSKFFGRHRIEEKIAESRASSK